MQKEKQGTKSNPYDVQIIIASGLRDIEKVLVGLSIAITLANIGSRVVLFFTMQAAIFASTKEGNSRYINKFGSVRDYLNMLIEAGVRIEVCSLCLENYCLDTHVKEADKKATVRPEFIIAGLPTVAIRSTTMQTMVF